MICWDTYVNKDSECNGVPEMNEDIWNLVCNTFGKESVIESLIDWLVNNAHKTIPKIPGPKVSKKECKIRFQNLYKDDLKKYWLNEKASFVSDYENIGECFGVLQIGYHYNLISDYFQRDNRMKCGRYTKYSPYTVWTGMGVDNHKDILSQALKGLKNEKKLDYASYRACLRLGSNVYTAPQFRVHNAKQIYEYFKASKVIDFSSGWGDRLAGFFTSKNSSYYLGVDPNPDVFSKYLEQCRYYDWWRFRIYNDGNYTEPVITLDEIAYNYFIFYSKSTGITVKIYNLPAEDINFEENNFDLVFTSPPYYCIEKYAEHLRAQEMQSWFRYNTPEKWLNSFLKPVIIKMKNMLKINGIMAINIIDPIVNDRRGGRVKAYDCMRENLNDMKFLGHIGLRTIKRPGTKNNQMSCEPIWIWEKI